MEVIKMYYYVKEVVSRDGKFRSKEDKKNRKSYERAQIAFNKSANALHEMMDDKIKNGADYTT